MAVLRSMIGAALFITVVAGCGNDSDDSDADGGFAGPPLETQQAVLDAAVHCTAFENPEKPPVLLVHGTFTTGTEQYSSTYIPLLVRRGFDVCAVTYPDRGLIDAQISAEYVVHALRRIHAATGRKVALIGHSQGVMVPRWAIKWWPSARRAVRDFVMIAGPNHGTDIALPAAIGEELLTLLGVSQLPLGVAPEVFFQFPPDSMFMRASNAGDETPGDIDYTTLYTLFDELVQPVVPEPTAAVDFGQGNPNVSNILLQDVCPGHFADHVSIGTVDALAFELTIDAIANPGPADVGRAGGASGLCGLLPIDVGALATPENAANLLRALSDSLQEGLPDAHLATTEPPLKPYAQGAVE